MALGMLLSEQVLAQMRRPAYDQYDVIALRVEFQADTTRYTTGNGTFEGAIYPADVTPTIDPMPHDAAYFEAHLAFLRHYIGQVSDGRTRVVTHLLSEIIRLPQPMGAYSPVGLEADSDIERSKLAGFIRDAWQAASLQSQFDVSGLNPARTVFMIFHAGVGRDIELLGTILDKTPLDIPSIYFSEQELARLGAQDLTFKGLPVRHTAILPRTESRTGHNPIADQTVLLELSINGLLAASFLNALGVPDLFQTESGESAIGPFGLMDPQGIFAYSGLFPPEPSAWARYYLGWLDLEEVAHAGPQEIMLVAAGLPTTTAVRVPISEAEYFLVENRNRDPEGDGLVLQVWNRGIITEQRVEVIDDTFNRFAAPGFIGGVVVAADNYDFALPGRDADDNQYQGGALIWHIDERVLAEKIPVGGVNANPDQRGVDLEEADSAQDIGFGNSRGSPFDFYFAGNPVSVQLPTQLHIQLYENRFGPTTTPASRTNAGGESFLVIEEFSEAAPRMTVTVRREASHGIALQTNLDLHMLTESGASIGEGPGYVFVHSPNSAAPGEDLVQLIPSAGDRPTTHPIRTATRPVQVDGGLAAIAFRPNTGRYVFIAIDPKTGAREEPLPIEGYTLRAPLLRLETGDIYALFTSATNNLVVRLDTQNGITARIAVTGIGEGLALSAVGGGRMVVLGRSGAQTIGGEESWTFGADLQEGSVRAAFGQDIDGLWGVAPLPDREEILLLGPSGRSYTIDVQRYGLDGSLAAYPVLADVDGDNRLDIVITMERHLLAFSRGGALLAGFPIGIPAPAVASPLVGEISDSGQPSVMVATITGEVYAFDLGRGGALVPGFPLAAGQSVTATPLLAPGILRVVTGQGVLRTWTLEHTGHITWGQHGADAHNTGFVALAGEGPTPPGPQNGELLVSSETYNWPNPIRMGHTFLRCMTREDAEIRITIIDAAGSFVDEIAFQAMAGRPVEHPWQSNAESGLYYARVTAEAVSGRRATKIVKMAVIR